MRKFLFIALLLSWQRPTGHSHSLGHVQIIHGSSELECLVNRYWSDSRCSHHSSRTTSTIASDSFGPTVQVQDLKGARSGSNLFQTCIAAAAA